MTVDLLVTGTGSLAEAVLFDLAARPLPGPPLAIVLAGRNAARLDWLAQAANARAFALGAAHRVACRTLDWDAPDDLARLLDATRPALVFHAASLQSMWEIAAGRDAWAAAIRAGGYGMTLPLQLALARRVARAIDAHSPASRLVNACYPDAANEILARLGHAVTCGVGNVATLAAAYGATLDVKAPARLRLLAHHRQVSAAILGDSRGHPPRVWLDAAEQDGLPDVRLPSDAALNRITGATAARLLAALLGRIERYEGHAPGPQGLPGGYPVVIEATRLELDLPAGLTLDAARTLNRAWGVEEGVSLDEAGGIRIGAGRDAGHDGPRLPDAYRLDEIDEIAQRMLRLRADLQRRAA
jgi:hypothetical protein